MLFAQPAASLMRPWALGMTTGSDGGEDYSSVVGDHAYPDAGRPSTNVVRPGKYPSTHVRLNLEIIRWDQEPSRHFGSAFVPSVVVVMGDRV